ncbi:MAG: Gfo/Idh/MocA family oxidoreductase [Candidatus Poribacteria bacterium]|nr:Gfo/Idh/MocA family oxidoreductase [Candidatus Poribacteria bacterium]
MADQIYKVGIVGCGGMGRSHAGAWDKHPRTKVVATADMSLDPAKALAEPYGATAYSDYNEMFRKEDLDIVSVTTWQNVRAEITVAAAASGVKGIIGEKPMADSMGGVWDMIEACEKHKVKLVIGHQRRFTGQNIEMRRLIMDGAIGKPNAVLRRDAHGLLNRGTHEIDEMRFWIGDPDPLWLIAQVNRRTDRWERRVRTEDLCACLLCFEGGTRGTYESDMPDPDLNRHIVYGEDGTIKRGPDGTVIVLNATSGGWKSYTPLPVTTNQYQEFIDWLDGKIDSHRNEGKVAATTLEILMAIYESVRIQDVVKFPLTTRANPLDLLVESGKLPVEVPGRYDIRAPFPEQKQ